MYRKPNTYMYICENKIHIYTYIYSNLKKYNFTETFILSNGTRFILIVIVIDTDWSHLGVYV